MHSYIEFITTPAPDTPGTTVILYHQQKRYVLGSMAEGTQRACVEGGYHSSLNRVSALFLTGRTEWRNMGGLMGMVLTLADAAMSTENNAREMLAHKVESARAGLAEAHTAKGRRAALERLDRVLAEKPGAVRKSLDVFGAKNITHAIAASRRFVIRKAMPLFPFEIAPQPKTNEDGDIEPTWEDDLVKVWAMGIAPEESGHWVGETRSRSVSGRKRSIQEVDGHAETADGVLSDREAEQQERDDTIRSGVVASMFGSSWQLDQLVEVPLSQVSDSTAVFVRNPETKHLEPYNGPLAMDPGFKDMTVWRRTVWPGSRLQSLPKTTPSAEAASYIIYGHRQRGRYDKAKIKAHGLNGDMMKSIQETGSAINENGETITRDMICEPPAPGRGLAVIELPSRDYVQPLIARPEWTMPDVVAGVAVVVWILGRGVESDPALRAFMKQMGHVEHIISAPESHENGLPLRSVARSTTLLNAIHPDRFPIPLFTDHIPASPTSPSTEKSFDQRRHLARRGLVYQIQPVAELSRKSVRLPYNPRFDERAKVSDEVMDLAKVCHDAVEADREKLDKWRQGIVCRDAEIITLGTGSAMPSKYRNVSATLLRVPGAGSYLLDVGENTLGQMRRVFTPSQLDEVLKDLKMIWISHLHADHHLGMASVIRAWHNVTYPNDQPQDSNGLDAAATAAILTPEFLASNPQLAVVSDRGILDWLAEYTQVEHLGYHRLLPLCISDANAPNLTSSLYWHSPSAPDSGNDEASRIDPSLYPSLLGLSDIQAVHVHHSPEAKGVSLTWPTGFKATYSGDCRPSKALAEIGKDSTVLIHEATFDDELQGEAMAKLHSTTSEALYTGVKMGAKAVVLTHFSQRYQMIPVMDPWLASVNLKDEVRDEQPLNEDEDRIIKDALNELDEDVDQDKVIRGEADAFVGWNPRRIQRRSAKGSTVKGPGRIGDMKVCVAFDYMRIKVGDIAEMEKFAPVLMKLFEQKDEEA